MQWEKQKPFVHIFTKKGYTIVNKFSLHYKFTNVYIWNLVQKLKRPILTQKPRIEPFGLYYTY